MLTLAFGRGGVAVPVTVKFPCVVAVPPGAFTVIAPVVAQAGTSKHTPVSVMGPHEVVARIG